MASLLCVRGPNPGRRFPLDEESIIGRQPDAAVYLESLAVSRRHARIVRDGASLFVEDLGSSNGTFVNGHRIAGRVMLTERDTLQVGPYEMSLVAELPTPAADAPLVIRHSVEVQPNNRTLFAQDAGHKLELMLEIAQALGKNLEIDPLLATLLDHLFRLFPQADRGMVLLCEGERIMVRAQRQRHGSGTGDFGYSRTIVRQALDKGVGLLSEDVREDRNFPVTATMVSLNIRSFLCVPLMGWQGRRLGILQLDCLRASQAFKKSDLELLSAIGLQAAVVLQNAAFHAERLKEERMRQELLLARDIQSQFLPHDFTVAAPAAEIFANCLPAREVSGDLYDFFRLPDGRFAFFIGDVSGKGTPAALFMIAVRTLARHLAPTVTGASDFLWRLNNALAYDNPTHLYVTMAFGIFDHLDGSVVIARGGHPDPLVRRAADHSVKPVGSKPGLMLGSTPLPAKRENECHFTLAPGDSLILYTDGYHEAERPDKTQFGVERLCEMLGQPCIGLTLEQCAAVASEAVRAFTGPCDQQDDMTLVMLRRT